MGGHNVLARTSRHESVMLPPPRGQHDIQSNANEGWKLYLVRAVASLSGCRSLVHRTCAGSYNAQRVLGAEKRSWSGSAHTCTNRGRRHTASRFRCALTLRAFQIYIRSISADGKLAYKKFHEVWQHHYVCSMTFNLPDMCTELSK